MATGVAGAGLNLPASGFNCRKFHRYECLHTRLNTTEHLVATSASVKTLQPHHFDFNLELQLPTATSHCNFTALPGSPVRNDPQTALRGWSPTARIRYTRNPQLPAGARTTAELRICNRFYRCWFENPIRSVSPKQFELTPFAGERQAVSAGIS